MCRQERACLLSLSREPVGKERGERIESQQKKIYCERGEGERESYKVSTQACSTQAPEPRACLTSLRKHAKPERGRNKNVLIDKGQSKGGRLCKLFFGE